MLNLGLYFKRTGKMKYSSDANFFAIEHKFTKNAVTEILDCGELQNQAYKMVLVSATNMQKKFAKK